MAKIVKPDLTYQWASAAGGGSVAPSSGKIQTGHIVERKHYGYAHWQTVLHYKQQLNEWLYQGFAYKKRSGLYSSIYSTNKFVLIGLKNDNIKQH